MKEGRKRVFARERIQVDNRTSGIRVAANPTGAMGDTRSSQVVAVTADKSFSKWAAFAPALGALTDMALTIHNKKETEAERQRRKAEEKEENRLNQLQAWEADKWTMGVQDELGKEIDEGRITSTDQLREWMEQRTAGLDEVKDAAFIGQARGKLDPIFRTAQESIALKARQRFDNTLEASVKDGISRGFAEFNFADPEHAQEFITKGLDLWRSAGKNDEDFNSFLISTAHNSARNLIDADPERAFAVLDIAENLPGGFELTSELRKKLNRENIEWEEKEETRARLDERLRYERELATASVEVEKAKTPEALDALRNEILNNEADLREDMGDAGFVSLLDAIGRQKTYLFNTDAISAKRDEERSASLLQKHMMRLNRGENVTATDMSDLLSTEPGDGKLILKDWNILFAQRGSEETERGKQRRALAVTVFDSEWEKIIKDAKITGIKEPDLFQREEYIGQAVEASAAVERSKFPEGPVGDSLYRREQIKFMVQKFHDIAAGEKETLYKSPLDTSENATSTPPKFEHATLEDVKENPSLWDAIEKRLFEGTDVITVGKASKSKRPHAVRINRKLFDSLSDPQLKQKAKDAIRQRGIDEQAQKIADNWYIWSLSTDQKEENVWRADQLAGAGDNTARARNLRIWFGMVDGNIPMNESYGNIIPKPEIEGE